MKFTAYIFAVAFFFGTFRLLASNPEDFPRLINAIVTISAEESQSKGLALLDELSKFDGWSFGGAVGPSDKTSLLMVALRSFEPFLGWKSGSIGNVIAEPTSKVQQWLLADPLSTASMVTMLRSKDPVERWIACEKLMANGSVIPDLLPILQEIAREDDYLRIVKRPFDGSRSPLGRDTENIFEAPIRTGSIELLRLAGEATAAPDPAGLSHDGLVWLSKIYLERSNDRLARFGMESALRMLAPLTPEIVDAQRRAHVNQTEGAFYSLFESLAKLSNKQLERALH